MNAEAEIMITRGRSDVSRGRSIMHMIPKKIVVDVV